MPEERPNAPTEMTGRGEERMRTSATCVGLRLKDGKI